MIRGVWSGGVLCGGRSSRMGTDKSLLPGRRGPWALVVAAAVRDAGVDDVWLVGGDGDRLPALGPHLPDDRPGSGPLAAIATLARHRTLRPLLVCACDLPDLDGPALRPLLDAVDHGAAAAVPVVDGRPAWSVLALSAAAAASVRAAVDDGARAVHEGLRGLEVVRLDLAPDPFRDVDEPLAAVHQGRGPSIPHSGGYRVPVSDSVPEVTVDELATAIESGAVVLDVRTAEEVAEVRVPGVVHVPLDELADRLDDVPVATPLFVICRSGARSARACEFLAAAGREAVNVAGGTLAWVDSGRDVERDLG